MTVSVAMITYGHEHIIEEAICGVLMQEVDFDVELIIADDVSPDNTEAVVKRIKAEHPKGYWIKYTKHEENKGVAANFAWSLKAGDGKYIAICEGDDYWTDSKKLQKQVDFLESNTNYSMVCHATNEVDEEGNTFKIANQEMKEIDLSLILKEGWFIRTASIVFRKRVLNNGFPDFFYSAYSTDYILQVMILKTGNCKYLSEIMSAYRHHLQGVSKASNEKQLNRWLQKKKLLDKLDLYTAQNYHKEISKQKKQIEKNISFYLLRYPGLLKTLGPDFYLKNFSFKLAIKSIFKRLKM